MSFTIAQARRPVKHGEMVRQMLPQLRGHTKDQRYSVRDLRFFLEQDALPFETS